MSSFSNTGASKSLINEEFVINCGLKILPLAPTILRQAGGTTLPVSGFTIFDVTLNNVCTSIRAIVVSKLHKNLLISWQDLIALRVINKKFPPQIHEVHSIQQEQFDSTKARIVNKFQETLSDYLNPNPMEIPGKAMHIYLQPNAVPNTISIARLIPLRMQRTATQVISDLLKKQVITKVNKPTPWCAPGFFVPKPNGTSVRLVTDYTKLNKFVKRPIHPFPSATEVMQSIPKDANLFAKLDAVHGYFQLALDEESSYLTTFLIPSGRYRYLRAPMGLSSSFDEWCRYSDFVNEGCEFAKKILIWAPTMDLLEKRILQILERHANINVTISRKKFAIGTEIPFTDFLISDQGIKPDPQKTEAIASFPTPKNITDLRSFLGLPNQLAFFLPDFSHLTCEMKKLLSTKNAFLWLDTHENEF